MKPPVSRFTINGNSMFPTLKDGQDVLSVNWFYKPKIGDIVVIKQDGKEMVKRVQKSSDLPVRQAGRGTFVMGDNQTESIDSRKFGPIDKSQIVGKVFWIVQ